MPLEFSSGGSHIGFYIEIKTVRQEWGHGGSFVLFCFALLCFALFCFVLFCFVLFCSVTESRSISQAAVARSWLTATSAFQVQLIFLPQSPE